MRSRARLLHKCAAVAGTLALVACSDTESKTNVRHDHVVDVSSPPPLGPSTSGTIPVLPGISATGGAVLPDVADGIYTDGRDLNVAPNTNATTWHASMTSDGFSTQPALAPLLSAAQTSASNRESEVSTVFISGALNALAGGGGTGTVAKTTKNLGFKPVQGRWLHSNSETCGSWPDCPIDTTTYPDPTHLDELRQRGARLYCAAQQAALNQPGTGVTMGSRSAGGLEIFGERVDFMVIEPTAVVHPPEQFVASGSNDGAQAFAVPLSLGTRFAPVRGLGFGSLPELRTPLTMVVGDTEVLNESEPLPIDSPEPVFGKSHQTVTFGENFVTTEWSAEATMPPITLFSVFIFDVRLLFGLQMGSGVSNPASGSVLAGAPLGWPGARPGSPPFMWEPYGTHAYYDGNWTISDFTPSTALTTFNAGGIGGAWAPSDPMLARFRQDADYAIDSETYVGMSAAVQGSGRIDLGPLGVELVVNGGLTGTGSMVHEVRDAARASLAPNMDPITGVVVTPRMEAELEFESEAYFKFWLLNANWKLGIYDYSTPLANFVDAPWPEASRLRLGTGSSTGDVSSQPNVSSHFPGRPEFESFPVPVEECVAEPPEFPDVPQPCTPTPGDGTTPSAEICVYFGTETENSCEDIEAAVEAFGGNEDQRECRRQLLTFLCQPTSMEQTYEGDAVVARVLENSAAFGNELGAIGALCIDAYGTDWLESWLGFGLCDENAMLFAEGTAVTPATSSGPVAPGTCL